MFPGFLPIVALGGAGCNGPFGWNGGRQFTLKVAEPPEIGPTGMPRNALLTGHTRLPSRNKNTLKVIDFIEDNSPGRQKNEGAQGAVATGRGRGQVVRPGRLQS
jgi:hypothetical protein